MKPTDPPDAPTGLRCSIERRGSSCLLRLAGSISAATAPTVRSMFLACLADEPELAVLDLTDAHLADEVAVTLFPSLARHAAAWPGSAVALAGARGPADEALRRAALPRYVPMYPSVEAALADARGRAGIRRLRRRLERSMQATISARRLVDRACRDWGHEELSGDAQLIITELVSNAVRHAGTEVDVSVTLRQPCLHLSVRDGSSEPPRPNETGDPLREEGRGLMVVEALAAGWGSTPTRDGKVVWATLKTAGGPRRVGGA
jgi:anti-sigma regulatory factor (Ser/Thr protein kinase)